MELRDVKKAIAEHTFVELVYAPADFVGITYTVKGVIMRAGEDTQTGAPCWRYYAELADKTGCITVAPLEQVLAK